MKRLLIDKNISKESVEFLSSLGYSIIFSTEIEDITNSTATHPDMQFVKIADKKAIVSSQSLNYYKRLLPDFEFDIVNGICSPYPNDTALNFVFIGQNAICTDHQICKVKQLHRYNCNVVKQGYTKCSICILNDKAILTGDRGIANSLENSTVKVYFLPCNEIKLNGYNNGFWGGATGIVDKDKVYFNGNIEKLSCYNDLINILEKEKIEPIYHKNTDLYDNGSIILLD